MAEEQTTQPEKSAKKNKKINKLSIEKLNAKIEEMEKGKHIHSQYYLHLLKRKKELSPVQEGE